MGMQGDFINGFSEGTPENPSILRQAMTTCTGMNGGERRSRGSYHGKGLMIC
jgi:hypothetical protein